MVESIANGSCHMHHVRKLIFTFCLGEQQLLPICVEFVPLAMLDRSVPVSPPHWQL